MEQAVAVGGRLVQLAAYEQDRANWVTVTMVDDRKWQIAPAKSDLYGGTSGIVLFLAYLGAVTGETKYTEVARAGLRAIRQQLRENRKDGNERSTVGAFSGVGSPVYLLAHLANLWGKPELATEAEAIVASMVPLISDDILAWYRGLVARKFDGSKRRSYPGQRLLQSGVCTAGTSTFALPAIGDGQPTGRVAGSPDRPSPFYRNLIFVDARDSP
jgi:hypothetical protein